MSSNVSFCPNQHPKTSKSSLHKQMWPRKALSLDVSEAEAAETLSESLLLVELFHQWVHVFFLAAGGTSSLTDRAGYILFSVICVFTHREKVKPVAAASTQTTADVNEALSLHCHRLCCPDALLQLIYSAEQFAAAVHASGDISEWHSTKPGK